MIWHTGVNFQTPVGVGESRWTYVCNWDYYSHHYFIYILYLHHDCDDDYVYEGMIIMLAAILLGK